MRVRYSPLLGIGFLTLGIICEFLGLWLAVLGAFSPAAVFGLLPIVIGVLYLVRPYFWVHRTSVEVPALIGPRRREYPFRTLEIDGSWLVAARKDGTRKKVAPRWLAHPADWRAVTSEVTRS